MLSNEPSRCLLLHNLSKGYLRVYQSILIVFWGHHRIVPCRCRCRCSTLTLPYRSYPLAALLLAVGYHVERVLWHSSTHQLPLVAPVAVDRVLYRLLLLLLLCGCRRRRLAVAHLKRITLLMVNGLTLMLNVDAHQ